MVRAAWVGVIALVMLVGFQTILAQEGDGVSWRGFGTLAVTSQPGKDFALGATVSNDGDTSITVKSVVVGDHVPTHQGFLREVLVFDRTSKGVGGIGGLWWPDAEFERFTRPLRDDVLAPGEELELVLVFEIRGKGPMQWESGTLSYEIDGELREVAGWMGFAACPGRKKSDPRGTPAGDESPCAHV